MEPNPRNMAMIGAKLAESTQKYAAKLADSNKEFNDAMKGHDNPPPAESGTMSAWRAEEVKNWTQALANLRQMIISEVSQRHFQPEMDAIQDKIRSLLGIADDK